MIIPVKVAGMALLLALCWVAAARAQADIRVAEAWVRVNPAEIATARGHVRLENTGNRLDRLLAAHSPVAERIELHTHVMESAVPQMRRVAAIDLPPGERVRLEPGGLHLMLLGLRQPLMAEQRFPITLVFERSAPLTLEFSVRVP